MFRPGGVDVCKYIYICIFLITNTIQPPNPITITGMNSSSGKQSSSTSGNTGGGYPELVTGPQYTTFTKNLSDSSRYAYQGKDSNGEMTWVDYGPKSAQKNS